MEKKLIILLIAVFLVGIGLGNILAQQGSQKWILNFQDGQANITAWDICFNDGECVSDVNSTNLNITIIHSIVDHVTLLH